MPAFFSLLSQWLSRHNNLLTIVWQNSLTIQINTTNVIPNNAGISHLSRMIGLSLLLSSPILVVFVLFGTIGAIIASISAAGVEESFGIFFLCFIPVICILAIYGFVMSFVYPFAQRGIIIDGFGVVDGIKQGWHTLQENISEIIILGIIFMVIGFAVGIVIAMVTLPIILVSFVPTIIAATTNGGVFSAAGVALGAIGIIVAIILGAAIGSIQRALQSTAFTLGYREWTGKHKLV